jgi:hypothetical protein
VGVGVLCMVPIWCHIAAYVFIILSIHNTIDIFIYSYISFREGPDTARASKKKNSHPIQEILHGFGAIPQVHMPTPQEIVKNIDQKVASVSRTKNVPWTGSKTSDVATRNKCGQKVNKSCGNATRW